MSFFESETGTKSAIGVDGFWSSWPRGVASWRSWSDDILYSGTCIDNLFVSADSTLSLYQAMKNLTCHYGQFLSQVIGIKYLNKIITYHLACESSNYFFRAFPFFVDG